MQNGCLYIRVSTDDQLELSPDAQQRLLLEYAHKNNIIISKEHIFLEHGGISGRKAGKRPAFQQMIATCKDKSHPIDVILVWKFSRFARNQEESIVYKSLLKRNNVDVVSISEPLPEGMIGSLVERIFEWMDEYYSINLSMEVTRGMTENALRGNYQGSVPIGYKHTGHKQTPIVDESTRSIVCNAFDMFNSGSTFTQIARYLNDNDCKTIRGGMFEARTVKYMLQNPFYIGKVRWNYYDRKNNTYKSKEDIIIADGKHEPIIDLDTWNAVQERITKMSRPFKSRDTSTTKHWLSGVLICSCCGASMSVSGAKSYRYFNCWKYLKGLCTESHYIGEAPAVSSIIFGFESVLESGLFYNVKVIRKSADLNESEQLKKQLKKIDVKLKKIKDAYMDGIDTLEEYKNNKLLILNEKESIEEKLAILSASSTESDLSQEEIHAMLADNIRAALVVMKSESSTDIEKGNALRNIVEKIVYDKVANTFTYFYYISI